MATASETLEQGATNLEQAAELADNERFGSDLSDERDELFAHADERRNLRRKVDKVQLRLAFRDLAEGVRGLIRVSPFTAVLAGALMGAALARRSKVRTRRAARR